MGLLSKGREIAGRMVRTEPGDLVTKELHPKAALLEKLMMTLGEFYSREVLVRGSLGLPFAKEGMANDPSNTASLGNGKAPLLKELSRRWQGRIRAFHYREQFRQEDAFRCRKRTTRFGCADCPQSCATAAT